jgi:hypothetical protein
VRDSVVATFVLGGVLILAQACGSSGPAGGKRNDGGADAAGQTGAAGAGGTSGGAGASGSAGGAGTSGSAGTDGGTAGAGQDGAAGADASDASDGAVTEEGTDAQAAEVNCASGFADCDGIPGNACEALTSDNHCGSCARDCTIDGAKCTQGLCGTVQLFSATDMPFGVDNGGARSWAFDATAGTAYWVGFNNYSVRAYPFDGSAAKVIWQPATAATAGTESIAVTGGSVYWSIGTVAAAPPVVYQKAASAASTVAPTEAFHPVARAAFLRVQGDSFYWTTGDYQDPTAPTTGYVYKRLIAAPATDAGTAIVTVDQGNFAGFKAFQPTSNALYWISDATTGGGVAYELRTTPLGGGTPTAVPKISGAANTAIAAYGGTAPTLYAAGATIYFTRVLAPSTLNGIYRFTTGDAAPSQLVAADGVTSFVVDGASIYYIQQNANTVFKAPLAGGSGAILANATGYKLIGQDAKYLYLLQSGAGTSTLAKVIK